MATLISTFNTKGGCGKTSVASSVALYLAGQRNKKVVAIDLDNNGSLFFSLTGTSLESVLDSEEVQQRFAEQMSATTGYDELKKDLTLLEQETRRTIKYVTHALDEKRMPDYPLNGPDCEPISRPEIVSVLSIATIDSLCYKHISDGNIIQVDPNNTDGFPSMGQPEVVETNKREDVELAKQELEKLLERTFATYKFCEDVSENIIIGRYPMKMFLGERSGFLGKLRALFPCKDLGVNYRTIIKQVVQDDPDVIVLLDTDRYRETDRDVAPIWMIADLFDSINIVVPSRDNEHEQKSVVPYIEDAINRLESKGVPKEKINVEHVINFAQTQNIYLHEWRELVLGDLRKQQELSRVEAGGTEPILGLGAVAIPMGGGASYDGRLVRDDVSIKTLTDYPDPLQCEGVEVHYTRKSGDHVRAREEARIRSAKHGDKLTLPFLPLDIEGETYCPFLCPIFPIMDVQDASKILPSGTDRRTREAERSMSLLAAGLNVKDHQGLNLPYKKANPFQGQDGENLSFAHYFHSVKNLCERITTNN